MTDLDLREVLREQRQHEPAFLLDPGATIRTGRRRRHVRTGVATLAVIGAVGAVGALGLLDGSRTTERGGAGGSEVATPPPPTAAANPDQPLDEYVASLAAGAFEGVPGARAPEVTIISPTGAVQADDPTAQSFGAKVDAADRILLVVRLGRPADGVGPDDLCETSPSLYYTCTDDVRADGSYLLESVGRASAPAADNTFRMYHPTRSKGVDGPVYFRRAVLLETPDGNVTAVDEFTRADTLQEAEGEWTLSASELRDLAADAGLSEYDLPHESWH